MLDQHQARTAIAEGPQRDGNDNVRLDRQQAANERTLDRREDSDAAAAQAQAQCEPKPDAVKDEHAPVATTDAGEPTPAEPNTAAVAETAAQPVSVSELIALIGATAPVTVTADASATAGPATTAAATAAAPVAAPVAGGTPQPTTAADAAAVGSGPATSATTAAQTPASVTAATTAETAAVAADGAAADTASPEVPEVAKPAVGDAKTQDAPRTAAKPASLPADSGAAGYKQPGTGSDAAGTPARPVAPAAGDHAAAPAAPAAAAPAAQQQPSGAAGSVNSPQQAPAVTRAEAPLATGVPLSRAAETVEHILRLAASRGGMQARVSLKPAELGSLEVVIRQTAAGLTARVVAEDAGAAHVLQQAGSELRRSLEAQGITLLNLDIGQSGGERTLGRSSGGALQGGFEGDRSGDDTQSRSGGTVAADDDISTETTVRLPNGALVDVLA
jgi:flagellar hook-length control protein FliK